MGPIALAADALAWLGRNGTRAVAATIFLSLAVPQLSDLLRPLVGPSIFLLLILAFLRVEPSVFRGQFRGKQFRLLLIAVGFMMIVTPLALGLLYSSTGSGALWRDLSFALILQAAAPPIMSAPAFAALLATHCRSTRLPSPCASPSFLAGPSSLRVSSVTLPATSVCARGASTSTG